MSLRLRLILVLLGIYCLGGYYLLHRAIDQLRPRYLESMEESLVDYAVVLASIVETAARGGELDLTDFSRAVAAAQEREFAAKIFSLRKTAIDLRVYVVDTHGRVVFDSTGRDLGADYSRWNDVLRTLRGEYGARSTRDEHGNDETQVIYVAAPIRHAGEIVGAV
ncbi:MAG TPA: two-component system sensor histidine kinase CreC, partial [Candidatus Synoicihabitans sp.]|nr:two-component system sensor histidine kinase CreC [Candidatus Synoicihabitans sp.]